MYDVLVGLGLACMAVVYCVLLVFNLGGGCLSMWWQLEGPGLSRPVERLLLGTPGRLYGRRILFWGDL